MEHPSHLKARLIVVGVLIVFLTACGGVPLPEVELEPLLVQPGDLPSGLAASHIRDEAPEMFTAVPEPQKAVNQQFERNGETQGGVTVLLYDTHEDVDEAYNIIAQGMPETRAYVPGVGAAAVGGNLMVNPLGVQFVSVELVFVRCHAIVHIRITGTHRLDDASAYAKRLDKRLQEKVCS